MVAEKKLPLWKVREQVDEPLWYLGYGSNMKASSMADRKVTPLATRIVRVPTHYVTFDVFGIPYSEPCYASIEEFPEDGAGNLELVHGGESFRVPPVCGLAHLLSPADFHRLLVTEGSGVVYDIVQVKAYDLDLTGRSGHEPFPVYTLKSKWPQRPNGTPSARYMVRLKQKCPSLSLPSSPSRALNAKDTEPFPTRRKGEWPPFGVHRLSRQVPTVPQS